MPKTQRSNHRKSSPRSAGRAKLSAKAVAQLAKRYLDPHQPKDYKLVVEDKAELQPDGTWYVFVHPSREDVRMYEFNSRVVEANAEMEDAEGIKVLMLDFKSPED